MADFATIQDLTELWRPLTSEELTRAGALLPIVSDSLRVEAEKIGKDLDLMVTESTAYANVVRSVTVDIVVRELKADIDQLQLTQQTEAALGYSVQQTYYVPPSGGIFIRNSDKSRLGLRKQRYGVIEPYNTEDYYV